MYQYEYTSWVPQAREGANLMYLPDVGTYILYGGVAAEPMSGIAQLAIHGNTSCKWDLI